jgi:hypothetical protein
VRKGQSGIARCLVRFAVSSFLALDEEGCREDGMAQGIEESLRGLGFRE